MRPAHPEPKDILALDPRRIPRLRHPVAEVVRADPTGVELRKEGEELLCLGLERRWGGGRIVSGQGVEEGPCAPAKLVDVGWAVRRERWGDGCGGCGGC